MFSRAYQMTKEFRERQGAFDFAAVALIVLDIAIETKKRLVKMAQVTLAGIRHQIVKTMRKPHQLVLELDAVAQIPLFGDQQRLVHA